MQKKKCESTCMYMENIRYFISSFMKVTLMHAYNVHVQWWHV